MRGQTLVEFVTLMIIIVAALHTIHVIVKKRVEHIETQRAVQQEEILGHSVFEDNSGLIRVGAQ